MICSPDLLTSPCLPIRNFVSEVTETRDIWSKAWRIRHRKCCRAFLFLEAPVCLMDGDTLLLTRSCPFLQEGSEISKLFPDCLIHQVCGSGKLGPYECITIDWKAFVPKFEFGDSPRKVVQVLMIWTYKGWERVANIAPDCEPRFSSCWIPSELRLVSLEPLIVGPHGL